MRCGPGFPPSAMHLIGRECAPGQQRAADYFSSRTMLHSAVLPAAALSHSAIHLAAARNLTHTMGGTAAPLHCHFRQQRPHCACGRLLPRRIRAHASARCQAGIVAPPLARHPHLISALVCTPPALKPTTASRTAELSCERVVGPSRVPAHRRRLANANTIHTAASVTPCLLPPSFSCPGWFLASSVTSPCTIIRTSKIVLVLRDHTRLLNRCFAAR